MFGRRSQLGLKKSKKDGNRNEKDAKAAKVGEPTKLVRKKSLRRDRSRLLNKKKKKASRAPKRPTCQGHDSRGGKNFLLDKRNWRSVLSSGAP